LLPSTTTLHHAHGTFEYLSTMPWVALPLSVLLTCPAGDGVGVCQQL
jgi:hypothetical protein